MYRIVKLLYIYTNIQIPHKVNYGHKGTILSSLYHLGIGILSRSIIPIISIAVGDKSIRSR